MLLDDVENICKGGERKEKAKKVSGCEPSSRFATISRSNLYQRKKKEKLIKCESQLC